MRFLLLACLALAPQARRRQRDATTTTTRAKAAAPRGRGEVTAMNRHYNPSQEHLAAPRAGTLCRLVERTVVVEAGDAGPAVHALRFALPRGYGGPPACCGGEKGIVHVHVKAPEGAVSAESNRTDAADGERLRPYSAELEDDAFTIHVKVYPYRGVSEFLGGLPVGASVHVPEIRAMDYARSSKRCAMVCFGVGVTECAPAAEDLLLRGAEVRVLLGFRDSSQVVMGDRFERLAEAHAGRLRVAHFYSRPRDGDVDAARGRFAGRIGADAFAAHFGGAWADGGGLEHLHVVGTSAMERETIAVAMGSGIIKEKIRGHPLFLLMLGPGGDNAPWRPLSPPEDGEL